MKRDPKTTLMLLAAALVLGARGLSELARGDAAPPAPTAGLLAPAPTTARPAPRFAAAPEGPSAAEPFADGFEHGPARAPTSGGLGPFEHGDGEDDLDPSDFDGHDGFDTSGSGGDDAPSFGEDDASGFDGYGTPSFDEDDTSGLGGYDTPSFGGYGSSEFSGYDSPGFGGDGSSGDGRTPDAQDDALRGFSNYIRGRTDLVDPNTGETYNVESGSAAYWTDPGVSTAVGADAVIGTTDTSAPTATATPLEEY